MSGRVPPSSRAGSRVSMRSNSRNSAVRKAALLYERFTGHDAENAEVIDVDPLPEAVAVIGPCDFVGYTTIRDGKTESYIHKFRAADKPLLCISPDGRQILLVGGRYLFTDRGIVDASDKKNMPRGR